MFAGRCPGCYRRVQIIVAELGVCPDCAKLLCPAPTQNSTQDLDWSWDKDWTGWRCDADLALYEGPGDAPNPGTYGDWVTNAWEHGYI
jgi:hypothetical protein